MRILTTIFERMFPDWIESWPEQPTLRQFTPPRTIQLDISRALPIRQASWRPIGGASLRVRAAGLRLEPLVDAVQYAWLQMCSLH